MMRTLRDQLAWATGWMRAPHGRRRSLIAVAAGAALLGLAGCGSAPASTGAGPTTITLVGGIQTEPNWWFPVVPGQDYSTSNLPYIEMMYPSLFQINNNGTLNFAESLGESVTVSHNDTTFTVTLRPWQWSNGQPVTAADLVYDWQLIKASSNPNGPWLNGFAGIAGIPGGWKSVTAAGPHTLVVTTTTPQNPLGFEVNGLTKLTPVPVSIWRHSSNMTKELQWLYGLGNRPTAPQFRVVDGPYQVTKFVNQEYWVMTANPKFSGHKAAIKTIVFDYEASDSGVYLGLKKGTFAMAALPAEYLTQKSQLTKYHVRTYPYAESVNFIALDENPGQSPVGTLFQSRYVRQALQMGVNEPLIARELYHGAAVPMYSSVPAEPPSLWYDPHVKGIGYNPAKGLRLMEAHGWSLQNGVLTKGGQKLDLTLDYESGDATDLAIVQLLKADWAREGFDVTLVGEPFNQVAALGPTGPKWSMQWYGAGWYFGAADPFPVGGELFECPQAGGVDNWIGFCDPALDKTFAAAYGPGTVSQTRQRMDALQQQVAQQAPVIFLPEFAGVGNPTPILAIAPWVHGVQSTYQATPGYFQYNYWTTSAP